MARKMVEKNIWYDDIKRKYYVNLDFGLDENKKRIRKTKTFAKIGDARQILKEHEADKVKGTLIKPKTTTLKEWLDFWMKNIIIPNKEATTVYGYQHMIENHINVELGETLLQKLRPNQIQQYYTKMINEKHLSSNTVKKHHDLLKTALKVAVKQDMILFNPIDKVESPKLIKPDISFYTAEDLKKLFELIESHPMKLVIKLAGYLGLRREEICGLRWNDIDLDKKIICIKNARTLAGGKEVEKKTKNDSSTRTLFINDDLINCFKEEMLKQKENKEYFKTGYINSEYVVVWNYGKPFSPNYVSREFTKLVERNNLPKITLHGLRHTFASLLNSAGVPMFNIGMALGHSTPSTTSKIYTHLEDKTHEDALKKIADVLKTNS